MDKIRIPLNTKALNDVLVSGCLDGQSGWVAQKKEAGSVLFKKLDPDKPRLFYRLFKSTRAISLTATLLPALAGVMLCMTMGLPLDLFTLMTAIVGVVLLQVAVNVFNDVEDYLKLIDLPGSLGGSGVIQSGWFSVRQMSMIAWGALLLALLFGLPAIFKYPLGILAIGFMAGIGVLGYSGKPFRFKYRALGDLLVFLLCGPILTLGIGLSASGQIPYEIIVLGGYFGFIACTILNANNINDMNIDTASGAKTLASTLGFTGARWLQVAYYGAAFICLLILALLLSPWVLLPVVVLPLLYKHLSVLFKADTCDQTSLNSIRFDCAKLHLLLSLGVCIGLLLSL